MCIHAAMWLVEAALLEANPSVQARKFLASQPQYTIDDDPFIKIELILASTLSHATAPRQIEAEQVLRDALQPPFDETTIKAALKRVSEIIGEPIGQQEQIQIGILINDLITAGARDAKEASPAPTVEEDSEDTSDDENTEPGKLSIGEITALLTALISTGFIAGGGAIAAPEVSKVFETMVDSVKFYANNHVTDFIIPKLNDAIQNWVTDYLASEDAGGDPTDLPELADLLDSLDGLLDMDPYWRTTANVAASRAYHYGLFKAGDLLGQTSFMVVNPMDTNTSPICQYLHGMVFDIGKALDQVEEAVSLPMDEIADATPFLPPEEILGKSPDELMALGVIMPPYHFNCRSWAEFIDDNS